MAIDNLPSSDESRLSGAYIRSLVKQLTSSKTPNPTKNESGALERNEPFSSCTPKADKTGMARQQTNPHGHKKQVRRRLHTSRPYQERLLNMAEARKEIVTALKFHRASMKQANERKKQSSQLQPQPQPPNQHPQYQTILRVQGNESSLVYPSIPYNYPSYNYNSNNNNNSCPSFDTYSWLNSSSVLLTDPPTIYENLNMPLPNQPLGLNLNLQAFTNLDTSSISTSTPSNINHQNNSSSSSSFSSTPRDPGEATADAGMGPTSSGGMDHDMHPALDQEEMAKIRSIGDRHQIVWDDTLDLVKSAWWFKFLKTTSVEFDKEMKDGSMEDNDEELYHPFGEFMEFPAWLSANENFLQQHLDDYSSEDYTQDTTLPWMDIGDIDGMDDEWLS